MARVLVAMRVEAGGQVMSPDRTPNRMVHSPPAGCPSPAIRQPRWMLAQTRPAAHMVRPTVP